MITIFHNRLVVTARGSEDLFRMSDLLANLSEFPDMTLSDIIYLVEELELNYGFYDKTELITHNRILTQ